MFKRILIALLFLTSAMAFGQGACYPGIVLLDTGRPANAATVRVCTAGSTGTPCTPTATLFTDPTLGTPLGSSPTVTTDSHGNYKICAAAGVNYDFQYSGSGLTTLTITNVPLPITTPITATQLTSASASAATVGVIKLASGDGIDWRNNANSGNIQMVKTGAAAGVIPADTLDLSAFGGIDTDDIVIPTTSGTLPATIKNDTAGGVIIANNAGNQLQFNNSGTLFIPAGHKVDLLGATSGDTAIQASAVAGANTLTLPAATDTLVGKATTDTLTNKTLTSPAFTGTETGMVLTGAGSGNAATLLNSQDQLTAVTGNGTDQTLYTFTIPANTVQAGKGVRIKYSLKNNNATALTIKAIVGATTLDTSTSAAAVNNIQGEFVITNKAGVQNAQNYVHMAYDAGAILANDSGATTLAENFANAIAVKVTVNVAAANTYTPRFWTVELIQ